MFHAMNMSNEMISMVKNIAYFILAVLAGCSLVASIGMTLMAIDSMTDAALIFVFLTIPWAGVSSITLVGFASEFYSISNKP